jgi:hypothetical protein
METNMAAPKKNPLRRIGDQISAVVSARPLPLQEQQQSAWAKVIESYDNVPEIYQDFFKSHRSRGREFPYTVLTPTFETSGTRIIGKLVYIIDHTFYVLEENETKVTKTCFPIDEINYVEVTHRPSDLSFKIVGLTNLGVPASCIFGCSNSTDHLFIPIFQKIRLRIESLNDHAPSRHMERLDRWKNLNSKVMDMAQHCLMAGETVIQAILQPEIRPGIFSSDKGMKSFSHTCILTNKELVMIREDPSLGSKDAAGSVCNFVPVTKIESLSMEKKNGKLLLVTIRLSNGELFEPLFDISLEKEVDEFLARTREFIPKKKVYVRD